MPGASSEEIARLEALHAQNPGGRVFAHLAEAYRRAGQAARARELLRRGLADHPDYPSAHVVLGRVLEDLGEPEAAERSFARVLDLDPHNMIALRRLAAAADEGGRSEEALAHWTALAGLEPGDEFVEARIAALTAAVERTGPGPAAAFTRASLAETGDVPAPGGRDEEPDRAAGEWDPFDEEAAADSFDAVPAGHGVGASARESAASGDRTAEGDETGDAAFEDVAIGDPPLEEVPHDDVPFEDVSGEYVGLDDTPAEEVSDADRALPSLPLMDLDAVELDFAPGAAEALAPPTGSLTPEDVGTAPAEGETAPSWPELDAGLIEELDGSDPAGTADSLPPDAGALSDPRGADWPEADARDHDLDEEFPGVETETLGDLYAAQGLHGRAAGVYRRLLRRNPADARLQAKLYEAESRVAGGEAEPVLPEWGDVAGARRPAAPPGSTAGRGPDAAPPFARAQETEPRAGRLEAAGPAEEPPAAEEPGAEASDEWPPLESPPEADVRPEEEPLTFAEPFAYGAGDEVRVGSAWADPGAAAEAPGVFEGEPVAEAEQDVPGALWTGEEFEGSVFAPGAPAGSAGEEVGTAGVDSAGGRTEGPKGAGELAASVGAAAADTEDVPAYDAGMTQVAAYGETEVYGPYDGEPEAYGPYEGEPEAYGPYEGETEADAAFDAGPEEASAVDTGPPGIATSEGEAEAGASVDAAPREEETGAPEPGEPSGTRAGGARRAGFQREEALPGSPEPSPPAPEPDSLAAALAGALAADRQAASMRDALRGVLSWTPGSPPTRPAPRIAPTQPGSGADRPSEPTPPGAGTGTATPVAPPPPPPPPAITPPDRALEPWSVSPSSAEHDASIAAVEGAVLELGEADLVRPSRHGAHGEGSPSAPFRPDGPAEPSSVRPYGEEPAPPGARAEPGVQAGAETPEAEAGELGDLARSLLDASVASDEGAEKSAEEGDDEEVEVFRSWLRSLKK